MLINYSIKYINISVIKDNEPHLPKKKVNFKKTFTACSIYLKLKQRTLSYLTIRL